MEENYFKLLKHSQELETINKCLSLEKRKELAHYQSRISDHFRWEQKDSFLKVMVDFLEGKIDIQSYIDEFYKIDSRTEKLEKTLKSNVQKLRAFEPDPRSIGFSILIENLFSDIRILEPDEQLRSHDEISEKSLTDEIKNFLPKIQDY